MNNVIRAVLALAMWATASSAQVLNVAQFGAKGDGVTDDLAAINKAIDACNTAGGVISFPAGAFLLSATPHTITSASCSVEGSGRASVIEFAGGTTGASALAWVTGNSNGDPTFLRDLKINCNSSNPNPYTHSGAGRQNTGVYVSDSVGLKFQNLSIVHCVDAFLMENKHYFQERDSFTDVTLDDFAVGFLLQQDPGDAYNSFEHNSWLNIWFSTYANGDALFKLAGGAVAIEDEFSNLNGNIEPANGSSSYLFYLDGGSALQQFHLLALPETMSGTAYTFFGGTAGTVVNSCGQPTNCVDGFGHSSVANTFGGSNWSVAHFASSSGASRIGTITESGDETSDTLHSPYVEAGAPCFAVPGNSIAAGVAQGTYISVVNWGAVTLTHPSAKGAIWNIWCQ